MGKKYRFKVWGGLGDAAILTTVLKDLKRREPDARIIVFGKKLFEPLFVNNPTIDKYQSLNFFNTVADIFKMIFKMDKSIFLDGDPQSSLFDRHSHTVDVLAKMLNGPFDDKRLEIYTTPAEDAKANAILDQYEKTVLIQITSDSSSNQNWAIERWEELIERMPDHTFIQVGLGREEIVKGAVNLLGKTSIRESLALIKNVDSYIGVDSFMNHASNAFFTRGVVLFGPSTPEHWGYPNNINLYNKLRCSPCMDVLGANPCPYNAECMDLITVEHVQNALETQLGIGKKVNVEQQVLVE
ncbi:MAG: ADP-heptose:LPS heptosyltransferase [Crocinitomix sp.]|jgi:ADP-heptose:LPS heptosyltransferase